MAEESNAGPRTHALLIGIDCYLPNARSGKPSRMNLSGCVRDIERVAEFLRANVGLPESNILKLTSADDGSGDPAESADRWPTRENIVGAFERLGRIAVSGDHVYVHYSGHGARVKTPPRFEAIKGGAGFDEALVPADYNYEDDRFLRDFELAHVLKGYVERGLIVTVVLDSCHSGGATREWETAALREHNGTAVRSIDAVDEVFPPPRIPVASDEELAASWLAPRRAASRDFEVENGWLIEPTGYVLLAACRPSEYAYEHAFDETGQSGALTYWLVDSLKGLGAGATFRALYDRVLAKVHTHFRSQTPQLQGERDRVAFAGARAHSPHSVTVMQVDEAGGEIVLNAGQAQGVGRGECFAVYPHGETDFMRPGRRSALVTVTKASATESRATIVEQFGERRIGQGDQAVLLEAGAARSGRTFRLVAGGGNTDERAAADALPGVEQALQRSGGGLLQPATEGRPADFLIRVNESGEYVIADAGGRAIPNLRPALRVDTRTSADRTAERLVHLTKYLNVQELDNTDPYSPLRSQVSAELLGTQAEYEMDDRPSPQPFERGAGVPLLKVGTWAFLKIQNNSSCVLNVTVLDLRPNWSIRQIYPAGAAFYEPLDPGQSLTLPLRADLPRDYEDGRDVIKVMATVGASNFRWLELPALDDPNERTDAWRGEPANRLETFLSAFVRDGSGPRDFVADGAAASHQWTTAQVEIDVRRA